MAANPLVKKEKSEIEGNLDTGHVLPSWSRGGGDDDNDSEDERLLSRASRGSIASRMSGHRLSQTEFENAPHKNAAEIDPEEAQKWLDPYNIRNRGIFASYLAVGFGLFFTQVSHMHP
jgi:hypothetical protein